MPNTRPRLALLGFLVLVCLARPEAATAQAKPDPPHTQVDLSALGYSGLSPLNRLTDRFNLSLDFIDPDYLLFTFNAHSSRALLVRNPDCTPTTSCHVVHAVVIDLRSNGVTAQTNWELFDYKRYLWPLGNGRFIVRRSNSIFLVGPDLGEKLLYSSPDKLLWTGITADRKQLILETGIAPVPVSLVRSTAGSADADRHERDQDKIKIEFRDIDSLEVQRTLKAPHILEMESLSLGYADSLHNPVRQTWLVRFGENGSNRQDLMQVRSPCRPDLLFPTRKTLFVGRCSPDGTAYSVSVFTLSGHPLWRQRWTQNQFYPVILSSDDGSRIAVSTVTANRDAQQSSANGDETDWPDVEQDIEVLEAATGNEILKTETKTTILKNQNYSLSPDGHRLALVDGTLLNLYDLPPMTTGEREKYVAMDADSPDLAAPAASSADDTGQDSSESDTEAAEAEPRIDLAAPVRTEDRAPMEMQNVPGQGAKPGASDSASANAQDADQAHNLPTITVTTEEVTVDAVVTDNKGRAVKGLSREDFEIQENGQPQELASFREYGNGAAEPSKPVASAAPSPNVFNNNDNRTPDQPMVVILLDFLNTELSDQQIAIQQLGKFLRTKPAGTRFALFLLTERLEMLQGFTSDENLLLATLGGKSARPRVSSEMQRMDLTSIIEGSRAQALVNPGAETNVQNLVNTQANLDAAQVDRRAAVTTNSFAALAHYLNATPGRKSLIWLSGSFPLSFFANEKPNADTATLTPVMNTYSGLVRETTNLLAESHIAVYPVNVRGLVVNLLPDATRNPSAAEPGLPGSQAPAIEHIATNGGTNQASAIAAESEVEQRMDEQRQDRLTADSGMEQVASETGGKAFQDANDLTKAMQTAAELSSHYYLLTYSPKKQTYDGAFRSIKVSLAKRGYHVAYRRGYYAVDQQTASAKSDLKIAMNSAAMEQGLPTARQMVFAARVVPAGKPHKAANTSAPGATEAKAPLAELQRYSVDYAIAASELRFGAKPAGHSTNLILMAVAFGDKGAVLSQIAYESVGTLNSAAFKDTQIGGLRMHQEFEVPANAVSLRLGVVDVLSGHLGTLELPLPLSAPPEEARLTKRRLPPIEPN
ncbi:MAG: VWA domain-containing protein [Terracidiphilus sp.]|jgi:VWFA-related protein